MDRIRCTFGKESRLRKRRQFLEVYERGDKVPAKFFFLYFLRNDLPFDRLGVTASRRIGKPVVRNRIKRRLREIFRQHRGLAVAPCDIVVNVKRSAAETDFSILEADFLQTVERWRG
ncbi:MAG: ribonuclease P protein component [Acidobacteriota bacterium]|nr:MAG: ribonuclease P protein component [Acidobacteriota bacterium]